MDNLDKESENKYPIIESSHEDGGHTVDSIKPPTKKTSFIDKLKTFWSKPKNRLLVEAVVGFIVIVLVGIVLLRWYNEQYKSNSSDTKSASRPVIEEKFPSILDGTLVSKALAERHPLAVIVENHIDARPQSGVSSASLVVEAIAEGGITRYLCFYSSQDASKIGPIRSARTYFVDFTKEFAAYLAHVGGNYDALLQIIADKVFDLDQFQNSSYYYRETGTKISSEHTVYSSTEKLYELATKKGYPTTNSFSPLKFKTEATAELRGLSQQIAIEFGGSQYKAVFDYDPANNVYLRSIGGVADTDKSSGQRVSPKNVILEEVTRTTTTTAINEKGYRYQTTGTGTAKIFRDGKMVIGRWQHNAANDRTIYLDDLGNEIELNPGQTWIAITHPDLKVTIQ